MESMIRWVHDLHLNQPDRVSRVFPYRVCLGVPMTRIPAVAAGNPTPTVQLPARTVGVNHRLVRNDGYHLTSLDELVVYAKRCQHVESIQRIYRETSHGCHDPNREAVARYELEHSLAELARHNITLTPEGDLTRTEQA